MPTYEYQCGKCGVFELSQRISDPALTKCPTCRRKVQRLISASNFAFKGTGWYVTDYGRKGTGGTSEDGGASSGSATSGSDGAGSSDGKTDSKTETKPAAKETKDSKEKKPKTPSKEKSGS